MAENSSEDNKTSISKNKKLLIGLILLIVVGAGAYLLTKNKNNSSDNGAQAAQPNGTSLKASTTDFAPVSTKALTFTAKLDTTLNGKTTTVTLKSDGKGNSFYSTGEDANRVEITYTKDSYYRCSGTNPCLKYPIAQFANSGFDPNTFQYNTSAINDIKSTAKYTGQKSCPAGSCYVWSAIQGSTQLNIFIDTQTSRISEVDGTIGKQTTKFVYDYKTPVSITPPSNAKSGVVTK